MYWLEYMQGDSRVKNSFLEYLNKTETVLCSSLAVLKLSEVEKIQGRIRELQILKKLINDGENNA